MAILVTRPRPLGVEILGNWTGFSHPSRPLADIAVVFVGIADLVRLNRHIHVDIAYRYLPKAVCRVMSTLVDAVRIVFFAYAVVLTWQMMQKMGNYKMTIIDLPMNSVYAVCGFGFACAAVRAVQVAIEHWRQGYSVLERPEIAIEETL